MMTLQCLPKKGATKQECLIARNIKGYIHIYSSNQLGVSESGGNSLAKKWRLNQQIWGSARQKQRFRRLTNRMLNGNRLSSKIGMVELSCLPTKFRV